MTPSSSFIFTSYFARQRYYCKVVELFQLPSHSCTFLQHLKPNHYYYFHDIIQATRTVIMLAWVMRFPSIKPSLTCNTSTRFLQCLRSHYLPFPFPTKYLNKISGNFDARATPARGSDVAAERERWSLFGTAKRATIYGEASLYDLRVAIWVLMPDVDAAHVHTYTWWLAELSKYVYSAVNVIEGDFVQVCYIYTRSYAYAKEV